MPARRKCNWSEFSFLARRSLRAGVVCCSANAEAQRAGQEHALLLEAGEQADEFGRRNRVSLAPVTFCLNRILQTLDHDVSLTEGTNVFVVVEQVENEQDLMRHTARPEDITLVEHEQQGGVIHDALGYDELTQGCMDMR